jgi:hypothetical protein
MWIPVISTSQLSIAHVIPLAVTHVKEISDAVLLKYN